MCQQCPHCLSTPPHSESRRIVSYGSYYRKSDRKHIQRFRCLACSKLFSSASEDPCYRQRKRQFNDIIKKLLSSAVSQRKTAKILELNRKTVVRKFIFLGLQAQKALHEQNLRLAKASIVEFDDMETFEHTKCKPLSITLAVEYKTRRILSFAVSRMPAKGLLASISRKKYGPRPDERPQGRKEVFQRIQPLMEPAALIKSDQNPHYVPDVKLHFPASRHKAYKGRRACVVGQGELKRGGFDPLFSLNHTCAKLRADINRLARRTWSTTKLPERLSLHLALAALEHNLSL